MPPKRRGSQTIAEFDYPISQMASEIAVSRAMSEVPQDFSYEGLAEKYPTRDLRAIHQPKFYREMLQEEDILAKTREAELAREQAELEILDTQVNQERAMYEQVPAAREAIAQLDPMDDNFLQNLMQVQMDYPLATENKVFYDNTISPLLRRNEMFQRNKLELESRQKPEQIQTASPKDYEDMVVRRNALLGRKTLDELQAEDPDTAFAVEQLNRMISDYQQQNMPRGGFAPQPPIAPSVPSPTAAPTPQPQSGGLKALQSFTGE